MGVVNGDGSIRFVRCRFRGVSCRGKDLNTSEWLVCELVQDIP